MITDRAARERVQHLAYALWEKEGCPQDRHLAHWLMAESAVVPPRVREPGSVESR